MSKKITITCYGQTKDYTRSEALKEFKAAFWGSEGHEQQRYAYIIECIYAGDTVIDDDCV